MDFDQYPKWNPFIRSIKGKTALGSKLEVSFDKMTFRPTILIFDKNRQFKWLGRLLFPGVFDGAHSFELIQNEDGSTTLIQSETFKGLLVPIFKKKMLKETINNFKAMNEALKSRAEQ